MKRFFIITIAAVASAVGCTKSGILESPQTYDAPISFEPYTGKAPVTKAPVVITDDLWDAGFRVIGFVQTGNNANTSDYKIDPTGNYLDKKVYVASSIGEDDQKIYATDEEGKKLWSYDGAMYWPEGKYLSFVAYGLNVNSDGEDDNTDIGLDESTCFVRNTDYTTFTYTVPGQVANQKDLVISPIMQNKTRTSDSGRIPVQMYHVLSRVGFKVKAEGDANIKIAIKNVSMTSNFVTKATYNLTNAVTISGNTATYNFTPVKNSSTQVTYSLFDSSYILGTSTGDPYPGFITTSSTTAVPIWNNYSFAPGADFNPATVADSGILSSSSSNFGNRYMMIMPQEANNVNLKVVYQLANAEEQEVNIPIGNFRFEAGKAYEFLFTLSTQSVGFNVVVNIWDPNNGNATNPETVPIVGEYPVTPTI